MQTIDQMIDSRQNARFKREERAYIEMNRKQDKAERMIGELIREGKKMYYVITARGTVKESRSQYELIEFLIRNDYV